ncbi:beta-1,6-N-acetylglucosaminyltransferase [Aestuariivirga sp.]|uniref:beta-1,6-N-acetylglucosaminyltransferase n=1 Tax=Aestuariivirga sp. TaxID=2650926 RepID=UPI003BAB7042
MCFLTMGDVTQPSLWAAYARLCQESTFYCHPKHPEQVQSPFLRERIIGHRVPTSWGGLSLVAATLSLFRTAYLDRHHDHFILLSETTIPIVPPGTVERELNMVKGQSIINFTVAEPGSEHFQRAQALPPTHPFQPFFAHDQWVILSRPHVRVLLETPRLEWFLRMFAPDEHYILNVLAHECGVRPREVINQRRTFVNWTERERRETRDEQGNLVLRSTHPKSYDQLSPGDVLNAREEGNWFFRKVSSRCDCSALTVVL